MPYLDGLPAAASVSVTDLIAVDQGGTANIPGTATTRKATISQFLGTIPGGTFLPLIGGTLTGPLVINSTLAVSSDATVGGTFGVTGATTLHGGTFTGTFAGNHTLSGVITASGGFTGNTVFGIAGGGVGVGLTVNNTATVARMNVTGTTHVWTPSTIADATSQAIISPGQSVTGTTGATDGSVWLFGLSGNSINCTASPDPFMPFKVATNFGGSQGSIGAMSINQTQTSDTLDPDGQTRFFNTLQVTQNLAHRVGTGSNSVGVGIYINQAASAVGWSNVEGIECGIQRVAGTTINAFNIIGMIATNTSGNHAVDYESYLHMFAASGSTSVNTGILLGTPGGQWPVDPTNGWVMDTYQQKNNNPGVTQRMAQAAAGGFNFWKVNFSDSVMKSPGVKIKGIAEVDIGPASLTANATGAQIDVTGQKGALGAVIANGSGYQVNDQIYDGNGGIINVDTISGPGGVLTAHYLVGKEPYWFGGGAPATTTTTGGSGNGAATFNVTWTALTTLTLQPTGSATIFGGTFGAASGQNAVINMGGPTHTLALSGTGGTGNIFVATASSTKNTMDFSGSNSLVISRFNRIQGPIVFSGAYSTSNAPLAMTFAASGSPTASGGYFPYMQWTTASDVVDVGTTNNAYMFDVQGNWGGAAMTGGRIVMNIHSNQQAQTGNGATDQFYQAVNFAADATANEGGTGLTSATARGHNFTGAGYARMHSGATNWFANVGYEQDIAAEAGSSMLRQMGWVIAHLTGHAVQGVVDDAGFLFADQGSATGWRDLIKIGSPIAVDPMDSMNGTVLHWAVSGSPGVKPPASKNGVDFRVAAISGDAWASTRHVVKGSGTTYHFNSAISQTGSGVSIDIPLQVGAYTSVASGGANNTLNDLYLDNADVPGVWKATAVTAGVVTAAALAQGSQPYSATAPATLTLTNLDNNHGGTFTVNVTWTANNELLIQPTAGGTLKVGTGLMTANGAVATALTAVGPTGSHTTAQEWLTVTNAAGTVRYIPCF